MAVCEPFVFFCFWTKTALAFVIIRSGNGAVFNGLNILCACLASSAPPLGIEEEGKNQCLMAATKGGEGSLQLGVGPDKQLID